VSQPTVLLLALLLSSGSVAAFADANEATDCWHETRLGPDLQEVKITVCLLEGGAIQVYPSSGEAPRMIDINLGYDALGTECWWRTAYSTPWVNLGVDSDGVARVGYREDGVAGLLLDTHVRSCTGRPREAGSAISSAWELINRHIHERPEPLFNPDIGITGLETFIEVAVPVPITDSLVSPLGTTVSFEIKVAQVKVDWGDGTVDTFTESTFPHLIGYPDGIARHIYETKTCSTPGGPRCHPTLSAYQIGVEFDWFVQWRVDAGPWSTIPVPNTTTTATYDVDEIVTRSVANP